MRHTYTCIYINHFHHVPRVLRNTRSFSPTYIYIYIYIRVHTCSLSFSLFLCTDPRHLYIYIYLYISSCWAKMNPSLFSTCDPIVPQAHSRFVNSCLFVIRAECAEPLMVALYLHACKRYIRIHVDVHVYYFVCSRRSNCATMIPPTSVL